jgi:hypothetical protein
MLCKYAEVINSGIRTKLLCTTNGVCGYFYFCIKDNCFKMRDNYKECLAYKGEVNGLQEENKSEL